MTPSHSQAAKALIFDHAHFAAATTPFQPHAANPLMPLHTQLSAPNMPSRSLSRLGPPRTSTGKAGPPARPRPIQVSAPETPDFSQEKTPFTASQAAPASPMSPLPSQLKTPPTACQPSTSSRQKRSGRLLMNDQAGPPRSETFPKATVPTAWRPGRPRPPNHSIARQTECPAASNQWRTPLPSAVAPAQKPAAMRLIPPRAADAARWAPLQAAETPRFTPVQAADAPRVTPLQAADAAWPTPRTALLAAPVILLQIDRCATIPPGVPATGRTICPRWSRASTAALPAVACSWTTIALVNGAEPLSACWVE